MDPYKYQILCKGLSSKRELYPTDRLRDMWGLREIYVSIEYLHESAKDYQGNLIDFPDRKIKDVWVDIDPKEGTTLPAQYEDALRRLTTAGVREDHVYPYFSGRGLHIRMPNVWGFTTIDEMKETLAAIVPDSDLIQNRNRIIRLVNTMNNKTGRYKIPIESKVVSDAKVLSKLAMFPRTYDFKAVKIENPYLTPTQPKKVAPAKGVTHGVMHGDRKEIEPYRLNCVHRILTEGLWEGQRHNQLNQVIRALRKDGWDKESIYGICWSHLEGYPSSELRAQIDDTFARNYKTTCRNEILESFCSSRCLFYPRAIALRGGEVDIDILSATTARLGEPYLADLKEILNLEKPYYLRKSDLVSLQGRAGLGKTTLMLFFAYKMGKPVKYIPLEDHPGDIGIKYARFHTGKTEEELRRDPSGLDFSRFRMSISPRGEFTISELMEEIRDTDEDFIFIDHIGKVTEDRPSGGANSGWEGMQSKGYALKRVAEDTGKVVVVSSHTGRNSPHSIQATTEISATSVIKMDKLYEATCTGCKTDQYVHTRATRHHPCDTCGANTYHVIGDDDSSPVKLLRLSTSEDDAGKTRGNIQFQKIIEINLATLEVRT